MNIEGALVDFHPNTVTTKWGWKGIQNLENFEKMLVHWYGLSFHDEIHPKLGRIILNGRMNCTQDLANLFRCLGHLPNTSFNEYPGS